MLEPLVASNKLLSEPALLDGNFNNYELIAGDKNQVDHLRKFVNPFEREYEETTTRGGRRTRTGKLDNY